jgi:glutaredoxin 3
MEHSIRLAVADGPEHDRLGLQGACHRVPSRVSRTILSEVMNRVTVYTTEPCGYCRTAKALLDRRGIAYEEINLSKDAEGRAELVSLTGMMTFPQVIIDGQPLGGFQELAAADRAGRLADLRAAA